MSFYASYNAEIIFPEITIDFESNDDLRETDVDFGLFYQNRSPLHRWISQN